VNIINGLIEGARDRWEGREAEAYLLGVRENIHLGWVGCIARQTEYGFGVMNESYVFTFTRCIKPMAFAYFCCGVPLFISSLMSASPGYAVQANT